MFQLIHQNPIEPAWAASIVCSIVLGRTDERQWVAPYPKDTGDAEVEEEVVVEVAEAVAHREAAEEEVVAAVGNWISRG